MEGYGWMAFGSISVVIVLIILLRMYANRYTKVGPNEVMVISGRQHRTPDGRPVGFRVVKGGGTFVWPIFEKADILSLELLTCFLTSGPTQSSNLRTFSLSNCSNRLATGVSRKAFSGFPLGRPKWLIRMTLAAPSFKRC